MGEGDDQRGWSEKAPPREIFKLRPGGQESAALERASQAEEQQGPPRLARAWPVQRWFVSKVERIQAIPRR